MDAEVRGCGWGPAVNKGLPRLILPFLIFVLQDPSFSPIPPKSPVHRRSPTASPKARPPPGEEISSKSADNLVAIRVIPTAQEDEEILAAEISEKEDEKEEEKEDKKEEK